MHARSSGGADATAPSRSRRAGRPRRSRGPLAAAALLVVAAASFLASFAVTPKLGAPIAQQSAGTTSAASGKTSRLVVPTWFGVPPYGSITTQFAFRVERFAKGEHLFSAGTSGTGISASVIGPADGSWAVEMQISPWSSTQGTLDAILVPRIVKGRTYRVRFVVADQDRITAWVDNVEVFSFSTGAPSFTSQLHPVSVGSRVRPTRANPRGVGIEESGFQMSFVVYANPGTATIQDALRVLAGLLGASALVLVLMAVATSRSVAALIGVEKALPLRRRRRLGPSQSVVTGILLVAIGLVLLQYATPAENAAVELSGTQQLTAPAISSGHVNAIALGGLPASLRDASALDETLTFEVRINKDKLRRARNVVDTMAGGTGIAVTLLPGGTLSGAVPIPDVQGVASPSISPRLPTDRWIRVAAIIRRSREVAMTVAGRQGWAFTYSSPAFAVAPGELVVGDRHPGVAVRDLSLVVHTLSVPRTEIFLRRFGQVMGFLAVALGAVLVARRILGRIVTRAGAVRRPLVQVTFAVAAAGIAANVLIDQLHLQSSTIRYFPRNSWLYIADARYSDFLQIFELFRSRTPYGVQAGSYPPFGYLLVAPFAWMQQYAALFSFLAIFVGFFVWWLSRSLSPGLSRVELAAVVSIALVSFPVSFAINRANVDLFVFVLAAIGIAAAERDRGSISAMMVGLIAAAKIVPGMYLFVLLRRTWRRHVVTAVAAAVVVTVISFLFFRGSIGANLRGLRSGLGAVSGVFGSAVTSTQANTSLTGWLQGIGYAANGTTGAQVVANAIHRFLLPEELIGTLAVGWYVWRHVDELWRAVTLVTVAMLVLPEVSYDYSLVYLFIPIVLFLRHAKTGSRELKIAVVFGLLISPNVYFYLGDNLVNSNVLVTCPLLLTLAGLVLRAGTDRQSPSKATTSYFADSPVAEVVTS